jgi:hypothetical protein
MRHIGFGLENGLQMKNGMLAESHGDVLATHQCVRDFFIGFLLTRGDRRIWLKTKALNHRVVHRDIAG